MNAKLALPLLALVAVPLAQRSSTTGSSRQPVAPSVSQVEEFRLAGGVPRGFMILGETAQAPPGFEYTGETLWAADGISSFTVRAVAPLLPTFGVYAAAAVDNRLYAIAVEGGILPRTALLEYDPAADSWATRTPMPTARYQFAAAGLNGKLYAIGGRTDAGPVGLVEEYDPDTDSWTTRAPMPTPRTDFAAVGVNGRLYAIGGYSSSNTYLSTVEEFEPVANIWTTRRAMSSGRVRLAALTVGGRILAIGGEGNLTPGVVEEYDPTSETWITKAPMVAGILHSGAASAFLLDGRVHVLGIGEYDPVLDQWSSQDLSSSPYHLPADVIDGRIVGVLADRAVEVRPPMLLYVHKRR